uniref:Uncharacterized protein n=1 Tax=Steinernema glaseri TaxID=37863 RepID=A0A1I7YYC7_9BILA
MNPWLRARSNGGVAVRRREYANRGCTSFYQQQREKKPTLTVFISTGYLKVSAGDERERVTDVDTSRCL